MSSLTSSPAGSVPAGSGPASMELQPRKQIEGRVMIMRKSLWSARYATVKDAVLSYKRDKGKSIFWCPRVCHGA